MKRVIGTILALGLSAGSATAGSHLEDVTVQLKWVTQAQFAGYFVAKDKGFYEEEGLNVTIKPGGPDIAPEQVIAGGGADVIYDAVGGDYAEAALRAIAWQGRFLVVGFPAGIPKIPLNLPLLKGCDICGVFWGAFAERDPAAHQRIMQSLLERYQAGQIRPRISDRFSLPQGGEAIKKLLRREAIGKIVVTCTA